MARDELIFRIGGDTSGLRDAIKRGREEIDKLGDAKREAARLSRELETADEKLAREQAKLMKLYQDGHITLTQYQKAVKNLNGDTQKAAGSTEKMQAETKKSTSTFTQGKAALAGYIGSLGSVAAAAGIVTAGLRDMQQQAMRGKASIESIQDPNRRLAQIATSARDLDTMQTQADAIALRTGVSRDEARRLVFSARSEGFDDAGFGDVVNAVPLLGAEAAGTVAGQFRGLFRGAENMTSKAALSGVLLASQQSRLDFGEIAAAAPAAAESAATAGTTSDELLASLSVLSTRFKSGLTAGDRLKAFQARVGQVDDLRGEGILGAVQQIQNADEGTRNEMLGGSAEVRAVYDAVIADMALIEERREAIRQDMAAGGSALERQLGIQQADRGARATKDQAIAKTEQDIAQEEAAFRQMALDANFDAARSQLQRQGGASAAVLNFGLGAGNAMGGEMFRNFFGAVPAAETAKAQEMAAKAQAQHLEAQTRLLEKIAAQGESAPTPADIPQ